MSEISWAERLELFQLPIAAALVAGLVCPLLGCLLYVRRTSFYGLALPQFATAGVVCGFALLPWWVERIGLGGVDVDTALSDMHAAINYHFAWAAAFTFAGLLALVALGRRGGSESGRVAAAFAIASAATLLFARASAIGKAWVEQLLAGEITGIGVHELETLCTAFGLALLALVVFHRDLLLVSYDRESARVLGVRVVAFEALLNLLTGVMVAVGTITIGPLLLFGLLVLPSIAARSWARSMTSFLVLSSVFGVAAALAGVLCALQFDLPIGAAVVAVAALELLPTLFVRRGA